MLRHTPAAPLFAVATFTLAACTGETPDAATVLVRDSAGVTIVENPTRPVGWGGWSVGPAPSLTIGALEGDPAYQLFRVNGAIRLEDGRIAVLNAGTSQVRIYGPDGVHRSSWGGEGEGPGEFMNAAAIARWAGDSVAVWDRRNGRLTLFDRAGRLGRSFVFSRLEDGGRPVFGALTRDGSVLVSAVTFGVEGNGMPENGVQRREVALGLVGADGRSATQIGSIPGPVVSIMASAQSVNIWRSSYQPNFLVSPVGEYVAVSATELPFLRVLQRDGRLARRVHLGEDNRVLADSEREAEIEQRISAVPEEAQPGMRRVFQELPIPDSLPILDQLVTDDGGNLWARLFHLPSQGGPTSWLVLDPDGRVMAKVEVPAGFDVYEIGAAYLLGKSTDDLDVERVELWPLRRGGEE